MPKRIRKSLYRDATERADGPIVPVGDTVEQRLRSLMEHPLYSDPVDGRLRDHVAREFSRAYPGGEDRDATGRGVRSASSIRPDEVRPFDPSDGMDEDDGSRLSDAFLDDVRQAFRDGETERRGAASSGGGTVHVREHTRDGHPVVAYDRAAPGGGGGQARGGIHDSLSAVGGGGYKGHEPAATAPGPLPGKSVDEIVKAANGGWVTSSADPGSQECVALVKAAIPELGPTSQWKAGKSFQYGDPVWPGTPIGRGFDENGNYPSHRTGNHAALFMGWWTDEDGNRWMRIAEQWAPRYNSSGVGTRKGQPARVIDVPASEAGRYRVITRK